MSEYKQNNKYCCIIGRDSSDCEQRELSSGTDKMLSEELHIPNYMNFLSKVRDNFLTIERGEDYYIHKVPPVSFFYCPLTVSDSNNNAAAVWGECGFYGGGREFRYSHFYIEDHSAFSYDEVLGRLFTSKFLCGEEITSVFDKIKSEKCKFQLECGEYDKNYVPNINESDLKFALCAVEKICEGKTVVLKLNRTVDFNYSAKKTIAQVMSLLPMNLRKQVGFVTYLQSGQIKDLAVRTNNVRLVVIDNDVYTEDLVSFEKLCFIEQSGKHDVSEAYEKWGNSDFLERERRAKKFMDSKRRVQLSKMISTLTESEFEEHDIEKDTTDTVKTQSDIPKTSESSEKEADGVNNSETFSSGYIEILKWCFARREMRNAVILTAAVAFIAGIIVGKIL